MIAASMLAGGAASSLRALGGEVVGAVGHLNPAAGFGPWPQALQLLEARDRDERAPLSRFAD